MVLYLCFVTTHLNNWKRRHQFSWCAAIFFNSQRRGLLTSNMYMSLPCEMSLCQLPTHPSHWGQAVTFPVTHSLHFLSLITFWKHDEQLIRGVHSEPMVKTSGGCVISNKLSQKSPNYSLHSATLLQKTRQNAWKLLPSNMKKFKLVQCVACDKAAQTSGTMETEWYHYRHFLFN